MDTAFDLGLLLSLDRKGPQPLHVQLERQLRGAVQQGRLPGAAPLPATRTLAADLGVSRGLVVQAYEQLTAEGYFVARPGSGTRVTAALAAEPAQVDAIEPPRAAPRYDFRPGMPDLRAFPRREWLAAWRRAIASASIDVLGYPDPRGPAPTRHAIASYLARSRATLGSADRIVLCAGFTQGIDLVARLLQSRGVRRVAIEEPGFFGLVRVFDSVGIATTRIPVDASGLVVERLNRSGAQAVVVTPAHQFPTGFGMTPDRRAALLDWAARRDAWIVEDDYDAEFRYDREPIGALQGLAPERVIHIGTTSKTLSPALRLGWLLAPAVFAAQLARIKRRADRGAPTLDQLALAEFIGSGSLDRHLKRMRAHYRLRRDALVAALDQSLPRLRINGLSAGLHLMLSLPADADERALVCAARERSIGVWGALPYRARPQSAPPALVLGYGLLDTALIAEGVHRLAGVIDDRKK